jgi:hypothetical protein
MEELISLLFALLILYWIAKGTILLFQRYNTLLVVAYVVFIFPVAFIHAFFLGIFGKSQEELLRREAQQEAKRQMLIEEEKNKLRG